MSGLLVADQNFRFLTQAQETGTGGRFYRYLQCPYWLLLFALYIVQGRGGIIFETVFITYTRIMMQFENDQNKVTNLCKTDDYLLRPLFF